MTLDEYINLLEKYPRDRKVKKGLGNPDSWRGSYEELAFEPVEDTTIGEMIDCAREVNGKVLTGYKGGDYLMEGITTINVDYHGCWTDGSCALNMLFDLMLGEPE